MTLIQLKLAAHRHRDFADVVNLITVHKLDESFLKRLHQSLHADFIECLEENAARTSTSPATAESSSRRDTICPLPL